MADTLRDRIKAIAADVASQNSISSKYRLADVQQLNPDGTVQIMLDGGAIVASPLYPVVKGQKVAVILAEDGHTTVVPLRPNPVPAEVIHPPFFTGGAIRFLAAPNVPGNMANLQDAFNSNVYQFTDPDPVLTGYGIIGYCLSPDVQRMCLIWAHSQQSDVHYRVYQIGPTLTASGQAISAGVFPLKATMLFEMIRTQYTLVNPQPLTTPYAITHCGFLGGSGGTTAIPEVDAVCALDFDSKNLYFSEIAILNINSTPVPANGAIFQQTILYQYINNAPFPPVTNMLGQWNTTIFNNDGTDLNSHILTRGVFALGGTQSGILNQIRCFPGIIDPSVPEMVGVITSPAFTGQLSEFGARGPTIPNTFVNIAIFTTDGSYEASAISDGLFSYPAVSVPLGPATDLAGDQAPYSRTDLTGTVTTGSSGDITSSKNVKATYIYNGISGNTPVDFISVMYKDSAGNLVATDCTNSISGDPYHTPGGGSSILPQQSVALFLMNPVPSAPSGNPVLGLFIDVFGRVRKVSLATDGRRLTIDTDITKFLKVSPSKDPSVDQTLLLLNINGNRICVAASLLTIPSSNQ